MLFVPPFFLGGYRKASRGLSPTLASRDGGVSLASPLGSLL